MAQTPIAPRKEIFGWAMFDFANSSYTTVIITVIYCNVFASIIVPGNETQGNYLWGLALAISYALVVLTAPIFGAIMDFSASRKKFLFASYVLTIGFTMALVLVRPGDIYFAMFLVIMSNFGFAVGESFVASFLPDLGPSEDLGRISGYAWALGYVGGLACTALVGVLGSSTDPANYANLIWVGPITGTFFLVAGIPTFLLLRERGTARKLPPGHNYLFVGFKRVMQTIREIRDFRDLTVFLIAFFFAYAGLSAVISYAFIYGAQEIKWSAGTMALMFILTQISATIGAVVFGIIQDKVGSVRTFNITLVVWIAAVLLIYWTRDLQVFLNSILGTSLSVEHVFLIVGTVAGLCLGATQSASRALVGVFSPESKSSEFFGFWGLAGKLACIPGVFGYGYLQSAMGGLRNAIVLISGFFVIAFFITLLVNEKRGIEMARAHEGE